MNPWWKTAIFYQIYPRSFRDSGSDGVGDLPGIISRLDYLVELGVTALWVSPFFKSPMDDFGYDISDYRDVDPVFGTLGDARRLIAEAHKRKLKIIFDLVVNHTSDRHPWFEDARRPGSPRRDWFVWSPTKDRYRKAPVIFKDSEPSNWTWDARAGAFYWHRFYASQPDLNYANPQVLRAMLSVADFWLALGVDGFRLDAVPYLCEREGTECRGLPETHAVLRALRRHVDRKWPGTVLLAEASGPARTVASYMAGGRECHMAFDFERTARLYLALADGDARGLRRCVEASPRLAPGCRWGVFLRNHDELALGLLAPAERARMLARYAPEPGQRLHGHIVRRLADLLGRGQGPLLAHALLLSLPGTPVLYYGDELGMEGDASLPDRFSQRTPMDWRAAKRQAADPRSLLRSVSRLLSLRRAHPALARGACRFLDAGDEGVLAFARELPGERILVAANLSGRRVRVRLRGRLPGHAVDLSTGRTVPTRTLELGPRGFVWMRSSK